MTYTDTPSTFSSAQAEAITGAPQGFQRKLRSRGFIEEISGTRAEFNLHQLTKLLILQRLSAAGIGPQFTCEMSALPQIIARVWIRAADDSRAVFDPHKLWCGPGTRKNGEFWERYVVWSPETGKWAASDNLVTAIHEIGSIFWLVFDIQEITELLISKSPIPLFTIEPVHFTQDADAL